ncbi:MAG: hypothetical protein EZS28_018911 [Streblomastix strix]|uniref:Uncharacterized protein n=1 Tax=Streblomastix strix TaxID=222440 RepID=A0A5J4VT20_9EUKA|nr:MAG: hypothetical protein EZS28_018911 [Streblomastix strix]
MTKNSHILMEIDIDQEGRDINPPQLKAKINQALFNRKNDFGVMKSYLLKYISKQDASQHHLGYRERQIEVQEEILRHAKGEIISTTDWRKFLKVVDIDLKLDAGRLQSPVSDTEEQNKEKDQSTAFWNNPRKRYKQDDRSNSGGSNWNFQSRYNNRDDFRSQDRGERGGRGDFRGRGYRGNRGGHN